MVNLSLCALGYIFQNVLFYVKICEYKIQLYTYL